MGGCGPDKAWYFFAFQTRARLWLLCSFLLAFGAVAGSVAVLVTCTEAGQYVAVGVGSVMQCGCILASSLLLWAFRTPAF